MPTLRTNDGNQPQMKDEDRFCKWWDSVSYKYQVRSVANPVYMEIAESAWDAALDNAEEIANQIFDRERERRKQEEDVRLYIDETMNGPRYSLDEIRDVFLCTFAGARAVWFGDNLDETGETEDYWKMFVGNLRDRGTKE